MEVSYFQDADIGLARAVGPLRWALKFGTWLGMFPDQKYYHVVLHFKLPRPPWNEIESWIVEAAPPAVQSRPLTGDDLLACDWFRVKNLGNKLGTEIVCWALKQKGKPYGHWGNFLWMLSIVRNWLRRLLGLPYIQYSPNCTNLVITAFRKHEIDFIPGVRPDRIWPGLIAKSPLVGRIKMEDTK